IEQHDVEALIAELRAGGVEARRVDQLEARAGARQHFAQQHHVAAVILDQADLQSLPLSGRRRMVRCTGSLLDRSLTHIHLARWNAHTSPSAWRIDAINSS